VTQNWLNGGPLPQQRKSGSEGKTAAPTASGDSNGTAGHQLQADRFE